MGRFSVSESTPNAGLAVRINRINSHEVSYPVYGWNELVLNELVLNRHFLVYGFAISLEAGDVVTLESQFYGKALYQEFSGYYLGSALNPSHPPTQTPTHSPTPSPTACEAPAPTPPLNIGFSVLSFPETTSTTVTPGSNAFSGYAAGSIIIDYDITASLTGGWDNTNFEYVAPSTGCVRRWQVERQADSLTPQETQTPIHTHT